MTLDIGNIHQNYVQYSHLNVSYYGWKPNKVLISFHVSRRFPYFFGYRKCVGIQMTWIGYTLVHKLLNISIIIIIIVQ